MIRGLLVSWPWTFLVVRIFGALFLGWEITTAFFIVFAVLLAVSLVALQRGEA